MPQAMLDRPTWACSAEYVVGIVATCVSLVLLNDGYSTFRPRDSLVVNALGLVLILWPTALLHASVGHLARRAAIEAWQVVCPLAAGLGYAVVSLTVLVTWFVNARLAAILFLLGASMSRTLPWTTCSNAWNLATCQHLFQNTSGSRWFSEVSSLHAVHMTDSFQQFWLFRVHGVDPRALRTHFLPTGRFNWEMVLCTALVWALTWLGLAFGHRRMIRVACGLLVVPIATEVALIIRLSLVPGAMHGLDWLSWSIWAHVPFPSEAQPSPHICFLLSGALLSLASYNRFSCRSLIYTSAGLALWVATVGMWSTIFLTCERIVRASMPHLPNIVFDVTPPLLHLPLSAISKLSAPHLWSGLYLVGLVATLFAGQLCLSETIVASVLDVIGTHRRRQRLIALTVLCATGVVVAIVSATPTSRHLVSFIVLNTTEKTGVLTFISVVTIVYNFGSHRLVSYISLMNGCSAMSRVLRIAWKYLCPAHAALAALVGLTRFIQYPTWRDNEMARESHADMAPSVWILTLAPIVVIIAVAVRQLTATPKVRGGFNRRMIQAFRSRWSADHAVHIAGPTEWVRSVETSDDASPTHSETTI